MLRRRAFATVLSRQPTYAQRIRALFGSSIVAYWPLWESSGTVATDIVNARNGAYVQSPSLAAVTTPFGKPAAAYNGTSQYINAYTASLAAAFPSQEGSCFGIAKIDAKASWNNTNGKRLFIFRVDAQNFLNIYKFGAAYQLAFTYMAGNVFKETNIYIGTSDWFHFGLTWSLSNSRARAYLNGAQIPADLTGVGTWVGALNSGLTTLLASGNSQWWPGNAADFVLLNREATAAEMRTVGTLPGRVRLSVLGDSISTSNGGTNWPDVVIDSHNNGKTSLIDHAVSGGGIVVGTGAQPMDAQTVAAAYDGVHKIIIALGTNDDNAGNMTALQAEYEENVVELKASNPNATIYAMNVLPRWTNNTTGPAVDKAAIRTAVAAACTAQGITCWDTFTTPWITQAQTTDGLHPEAAGHAAIATQVLARL